VNQYETQGIAGILISRGHMQTEADEGCDVCIINTCAVTAESVRKSRQAIRRLKKLAPDAIIAVCGCLSQLDPGAADELGADLVGGSGDRHSFALAIEELWNAECRMQNAELSIDPSPPDTSTLAPSPRELSAKLTEGVNPTVSQRFEELPPGVAAGRTRALLKIQDGCDNYCAYCIIPYARGSARSLPVERAADYARKLDEQGFREIVVTGIEISSYGKDLVSRSSLSDVIHTISNAAPRARLRLGSLDPGIVTDMLCRELYAVPSLCDHFHLSLQSGCDETLRRMGRKYDTSAAYKAISALRRSFPGCGITADLIVGFPGETDAEFEQTMIFIKTARFSDMHIFPFSARPGTKAADMPEQVMKSVKRERARITASTAEDLARLFRLSQIGKTLEVLFERKRDGYWTGHSRNYLEVTVKGVVAKNSVHNVQIASVKDDLIWGEKI